MAPQPKENGDNKFWFKRGGRGIKIFPRVGSTTLREAWGGNECGKGEFMKCNTKVVIVRNPWKRLLSVFEGMICSNAAVGLQALGYPPKTQTLDGLLEWIIETPSERLDWHVRSMWDQLMGFEPEAGELFTLEQAINGAVSGLNKPSKHHHRTPDVQRKEREYTQSLRDEWEQLYENDWTLFYKAEKRF